MRGRWREMGTASWPVLHIGFLFRFVANGLFSGLLVGSASGGRIYFYERDASVENPLAASAFIDRGPLFGEGPRLRGEGYASPFPCDPDGDDDVDFIIGDEPGFIRFAENVGSRSKPRFLPPRPLYSDGSPIRIWRENLLHDRDLEMWCGQTKPILVDWDDDGAPDLIVGNNTNRLLFLKGMGGGRFESPQEIRVRGDAFPFAWRKRPFAVDWNRDGRLELIAVDKRQRICLFDRTDDPLLLERGVVLRYIDGEEITTNSIPPGIYRNPVVCLWACDWDRRGLTDLLVSSNLETSILRNAGIEGQLVFHRPSPLSTPEGIIRIGHHETSVAAVDWDLSGDLDLIIGGESGSLYFFRRDYLDGTTHKCRVLYSG